VALFNCLDQQCQANFFGRGEGGVHTLQEVAKKWGIYAESPPHPTKGLGSVVS